MTSIETWDAVCIGSGLGSLAAAVTLAQAGKRVLVLERLSNFGGAATIYRHGQMTIEASLHATDGRSLFDEGSVYPRLGLGGRITPVPIGEMYEVRGGPIARPLRIPSGLDAAEAAVAAAFPEAARPVSRYFAMLRGMERTLRVLDNGATGGAMLREVLSGRLPRLLSLAPRTLASVLDGYFGGHEAVKVALGAMLGYFDDDPSRLAFLLYAGNWARYCEGGAYNIRGGSAALTRAMVETVRLAGGTALRRATVTEILTDARGRATGVAWAGEDGAPHEALAPLVMAGTAPDHLARMLPAATAPRFRAAYAGRKPAVSLFSVAIGLSRPAAEFGVSAFSTFVVPQGAARLADMPRAAAVFGTPPSGGVVPPYVIADGGRLGTGLHREGDLHAISLTGIDRLAWWDGLDAAGEMDRRARWTDALLADLDSRFPGIGSVVAQAEIATARTMMNRLGTPEGEVYGFVPTPARMFRSVPSGRTPVPGLYLASAYTLSGGFVGAMRGGIIAARGALSDRRD